MGTIFALVSFVVFIGVCFAAGLRIVNPDENAVVVRLGKADRIISSGLRYIIWPIESEKRFTTNVVELQFARAGVITAKKDGLGEVNIGLDINMYFRWPEGNDLMDKTIRVIADPENLPALVDLFEETVLDTARSVASAKTWKEIITDRSGFAKEIREYLLDEESDLLNQAGISKDTIRLAVKHVDLPENFEKILTEPEIQRMKAEAAKHEAKAIALRLEGEGEGLKKKKSLEGEGDAAARKALFEAIGNEPENIQKEILLTLREMATGTSNTILFPIPTKLTDVLENIFGKSGPDLQDFFSGMSKENQAKLAKMFEEMVKNFNSQGAK